MSKLPQFELGRVLMTPGALDAMVDAGVRPSQLVSRHVFGDWGDVDKDDANSNQIALKKNNPLRILSAYKLTNGFTVWIITEHDRSVTTLLLPSEY